MCKSDRVNRAWLHYSFLFSCLRLHINPFTLVVSWRDHGVQFWGNVVFFRSSSICSFDSYPLNRQVSSWLLISHVLSYSVHEVIWNRSIYNYTRRIDCFHISVMETNFVRTLASHGSKGSGSSTQSDRSVNSGLSSKQKGGSSGSSSSSPQPSGGMRSGSPSQQSGSSGFTTSSGQKTNTLGGDGAD